MKWYPAWDGVFRPHPLLDVVLMNAPGILLIVGMLLALGVTSREQHLHRRRVWDWDLFCVIQVCWFLAIVLPVGLLTSIVYGWGGR